MSASQDDGVVHLNVDSHSNHDKHGGGTLSKTGHHVDISPLAVNIRQNNNNTSNHNNNEPSPTKQTS